MSIGPSGSFLQWGLESPSCSVQCVSVCVHACPHVCVHSHTCRVSARCYTCSGQGQVEKKAFGCSCYSTCEAGCEADVSSSQPNARCRPRHLQPHLCLAVMERGWLSPSCLPSSPEPGKGIAVDVFPRHGLFFSFADFMHWWPKSLE